jgi:hypothetical protein
MSVVIHARVVEQLSRLRLRYVAERLDAVRRVRELATGRLLAATDNVLIYRRTRRRQDAPRDRPRTRRGGVGNRVLQFSPGLRRHVLVACWTSFALPAPHRP